MKGIKDFYEWLFDHETHPLFTMLFVTGAVLFGLVSVILLVAFAPIFAVGFGLLVVFGLPIAAYLVHKSGEK